MKKNYWIMMLCLLAGSFAGCSDDDNGPTWKELFDQERSLIRNFIADKSPRDSMVFQVEFKGEKFEDVAYVFDYSTDADKKKPKDKQFILVNYTDRNLGGTILDDTRASVIGGEKIEIPRFPLGGPIYEEIISDEEVYSNFLKHIPEGTSGSIILSSMLASRSTYLYRQYTVEKIIDMELLDYEYHLMDEFLDKKGFDKNNIIKVPTEGNDTITQIAKFGGVANEDILPNDSVTVHCNGYILDEISGADLTNRQILKMKEGEKVAWKVSGLIEGLRVGLLEMKVGEKAYILIPSGRAYGKGAINSYYQYIMPPYATLMYEVEVLSRKANDK